ncbi:putative bifunctional phosphatase/peptidyl-prolyl cis-trans isomerase [Saccharicrinis fermentans DSM 9555 = JCM 21142]|uniref:peptidylprolyl isomerase n=2 Tax=Saccharicrinis fermentans TaxID=982 RepID=W7Y4B8_9BACT|nr:putative bifunctional phosphatase/peptidyl-prolyl cis-trans isomerase [Saccharicrinis fermentans DSM 9555 = JCM 21142]
MIRLVCVKIKVYVAILWLVLFSMLACQPRQQKSTMSQEERMRPKGSYQRNIKSVVTIECYDHYNRLLKRGYGFYISRNSLVTHLDLIKGSYKAKVTPVGTEDYSDVAGYLAYDIENNLVILKTWKENLHYLHLEKSIRHIPDSIAGLYRKSTKIYAPKVEVDRIEVDSTIHYFLSKKIASGLPAFTFLHHPVGMVLNQQTDSGKVCALIPSAEILALNKRRLKREKSIYDLRRKTNKVYPSYKEIKGFRIETTMGNIDIVLYNQTPVFRDNFIRLVSDHFYDSLLVHRVLKNFLIQTGAADSKYAGKDDLVGWQGPGYNLKTTTVPGLFHKRGAVAASKMPPERNPKDRSDGSQFYIVSGRIFSRDELKDIEKQKGIRFTPEQISTYNTLGGAPHLDGDYVVFGEVKAGMDVVDRIAAVETYAVDRPVDDIRIMHIDILKK